MIRRILIFVLLIVLIGIGSDALAQRTRSRRGTNGMVWLFHSRNSRLFQKIQIELRTNPKQIQLITALRRDMDEQTENTREAASGHGPESSPTLSKTEQRELELRINKVSEEIIATILDVRQFARAQEVTLQWQGYRAFESADFRKRLKLTKKQQTDIAEILKRADLTEDDKGEISDILTADQHKLWMKLKGAPFGFPKPRGRSGNRFRSRGLPEDN